MINNNNSATATATATTKNSNPDFYERAKNKWVALLLCIFTIFGHKFYQGNMLMGIVYLVTLGLCGIEWIVDIISLAMKPNPYYGVENKKTAPMLPTPGRNWNYTGHFYAQI